MEKRLIDANGLDKYAVTIGGHRYIPWVDLAEVPTADAGPARMDRSRWKGCKNCNRPSFEIVFGSPFCPTCGKPQSEAAWAELERRIGGNNETTD